MSDDDPAHAADADLIRRLVSRDETALDDLYARYAPLVYSCSCRIARDAGIADEATQDVFVQAWRDASRYDPARGTVRGWLMVMARARTLDRLRNRQAHGARLTSLEAMDVDRRADGDCLDRMLSASEDANRVNDALRVFPDEDRRLIDLAYREGLTHTEIAARLALPLGTVKTNLRRILRLMRRAIVEQPARPFEWSTARPTPRSAAPLHGMKVVVVDDDADTLRLLTLVLERAGASVLPASSAMQARRRLAVTWPDVFVTDLEMPSEDGYALLRGLREMRDGRELPAVAFSAHGTKEDQARTHRAGFSLHLAKPVSPSVLVARLAGLVASTHS